MYLEVKVFDSAKSGKIIVTETKVTVPKLQ